MAGWQWGQKGWLAPGAGGMEHLFLICLFFLKQCFGGSVIFYICNCLTRIELIELFSIQGWGENISFHLILQVANQERLWFVVRV